MRLNLWLTGVALLLAALLAGAGCSGKHDHKDEHKKADAGKKDDDDHDDHGPGPHGGLVVEWGSKHEYHPEFTVDHPTKKATVYILGRDARKASPIAAESITLTLTNVTPPVQITLKADPEASDPKGKASRFSGTHDTLGKKMDFKGEIRGEIDGKQYTGKFEEKDHD